MHTSDLNALILLGLPRRKKKTGTHTYRKEEERTKTILWHAHTAPFFSCSLSLQQTQLRKKNTQKHDHCMKWFSYSNFDNIISVVMSLLNANFYLTGVRGLASLHAWTRCACRDLSSSCAYCFGSCMQCNNRWARYINYWLNWRCSLYIAQKNWRFSH